MSEDEKGMPVRLKIDNGKEYVRSFNTNGAGFPFSVPGATINYQQGFSGGNLDWADKDYQLVSAHEIGHPILTLAAGREYSWSHEGTSGTLGGDNGTYAPVPKTGEMNLMKYYEDASVNMRYARSIASESDVKNLIYISKRH
ncbi:hypothetical protein [Pandoraea terrigena]|uniref:hypothetical protein n=1 Tax=Pandoraea terrigena TaxID=2508292 RepID=UPI001241C719|nr:hypothetical protein [Pandoraea terrigena]